MHHKEVYVARTWLVGWRGVGSDFEVVRRAGAWRGLVGHGEALGFIQYVMRKSRGCLNRECTMSAFIPNTSGC